MSDRIEQIRERLAQFQEPLIVVRSVAYRNPYGSIVPESEVKYFVTTETMRANNAYFLDTYHKSIADFVANAQADLAYLLEQGDNRENTTD